VRGDVLETVGGVAVEVVLVQVGRDIVEAIAVGHVGIVGTCLGEARPVRDDVVDAVVVDRQTVRQQHDVVFLAVAGGADVGVAVACARCAGHPELRLRWQGVQPCIGVVTEVDVFALHVQRRLEQRLRQRGATGGDEFVQLLDHLVARGRDVLDRVDDHAAALHVVAALRRVAGVEAHQADVHVVEFAQKLLHDVPNDIESAVAVTGVVVHRAGGIDDEQHIGVVVGAELVAGHLIQLRVVGATCGRQTDACREYQRAEHVRERLRRRRSHVALPVVFFVS
jgi:hypothetical protein